MPNWIPVSIAVALTVLSAIPAIAGRNHINIREGDGWIATAHYPDVDGDSPVQSTARDEAVRITRNDQHEFVVWALGEVKSTGKAANNYEYVSTPTTSLDRKDLVSVFWYNEWDMGGEHPNYLYDACSIGLMRGRPAVLRLQDLFRPGVDATKSSAAAIIAVLKQDEDAADVQDGTLSAKTPGLVAQFYLGDTAITFILSPSIIGKYAVDGATTVKIPYKNLSGDLDHNGPLRQLLR